MSNPENGLKAFNTRLEWLKTTPYHKLPNDVQHYFSQNDIHSIVDATILILNQTDSTIDSLLRIDKNDTRYQPYKLPRSFCIIRDNDNEYQLIVDTEYKKSNGDDDSQDKLYTGTFKLNHPSLRIDSLEPTQLITQTVFGTNGLKSVENEIRFLKSFGQHSDLFCIPLAIQKTALFNRPCYILITKRAKCDLYDLIEKETLNLEQKYRIAKQILAIVHHIHENHWLHQDIALRNFIVFEENNTYTVKLTDFGATRPTAPEDINDIPYTFPPTLVYASPELIDLSLSKLKNFTSDELILEQKKILKSTIGGRWLMTNQNRQRLQADIKHENIVHDMKNDVWACGLVIHRLFNGTETLPKIQTQYPTQEAFSTNTPIEGLIHAMLEPYRTRRILIKEAVKHLEEIMQKLTYTN